MPYVFKKHYTREQARALMPQVSQWLTQLKELHAQSLKQEQRLEGLMARDSDLGGSLVNGWVRSLAAIRGLLLEFQTREIQVKDLERGLVDFPAVIGGKEVFLCWEQGEEDIEFWHDLDTGYAGRTRLPM
jgi:hypothetical protein